MQTPQLSAWAAVIGALIATMTAVLLFVGRDLLLEGKRAKERHKRELVEAKLREIYSPLWVCLGGENGALTNILASEPMRDKLGANFHLLSPEMKQHFDKLLLVGKLQNGSLLCTAKEQQLLVDSHKSFVETLKKDLAALQSQFES